MHTGTPVRILANGTKSRIVPVKSGIRQGCPLAPLLFIIALDPLYRKLDGAPELRGIKITTAHHCFTLFVAGYADDTAVYLRRPEDVQPLLKIAIVFGKASGLRINANKTIVVALHPDGAREGMKLPDGFEFLGPKDAKRYLGLQAGSDVPVELVWALADAQLRIRLRLAMQKSMTVAQRSLIAKAVIHNQAAIYC